MGRLTYDSTVRWVIDDRTLAHLQVVIGDKLRRREAFTFTWPSPFEEGGGRTAVWLNPASGMVFRFDGRGSRQLNRAWLDVLFAAANSPAGLEMIAEPETAEPGTDGP